MFVALLQWLISWDGTEVTTPIATCHFKLSPKQSKCLMSSSSRTSHRSSMLKWSPSFPQRKRGSKIGKFSGMNVWGPWSTKLWSRLKMGKIRLFQPGKCVVNHDKWDIDHIKASSTLGFGLPHFETWSLMNPSGTWRLLFDLRRTPLVCKTAHLQMLNLYIYTYIWFACTYVIYVYMYIYIYIIYIYEHAIYGWKWTWFRTRRGHQPSWPLVARIRTSGSSKSGFTSSSSARSHGDPIGSRSPRSTFG